MVAVSLKKKSIMSISRFGSERIVRAAFEYAREHGRSKVTAAHQANIFFFQAEDGIRDIGVTGVQTCALPISLLAALPSVSLRISQTYLQGSKKRRRNWKIGRASCRERV